MPPKFNTYLFHLSLLTVIALAIWTGLYFFAILLFVIVFLFKFRSHFNLNKKLEVVFRVIGFVFPVLLLALILRALFFDVYMVNSYSMKKCLVPGDVLLVNKLSFGPRIKVEKKYKRAKGIGKIDLGEIIVFNYPEGDSVSNKIIDYSLAKRKGVKIEKNDIDYVKISKRTRFVKRVVGRPGDTIFLKNGELFVNGNKKTWKTQCTSYKVFTNGKSLTKETFSLLNMNLFEQKRTAVSNFEYIFNLSKSDICIIKNDSNYVGHEKISYPLTMPFYKLIFPHSTKYLNTIDDFDTIVVPAKGDLVKITEKNSDIYKRIICVYENNNEINYDSLVSNKADYRFQMDYFWVMGDNRHLSMDSRYWGFVPENHIIGKADFIVFTSEKFKAKPKNNIRRIFKKL